MAKTILALVLQMDDKGAITPSISCEIPHKDMVPEVAMVAHYVLSSLFRGYIEGGNFSLEEKSIIPFTQDRLI
jgi:hypothetical protein